MISLLTDEDLDGNIVRGVLRRLGGLDFVRLQDVGLTDADDPKSLAWSARHGRVMITHDVDTVTRCAFEPFDTGLPRSGDMAVIDRQRGQASSPEPSRASTSSSRARQRASSS